MSATHPAIWPWLLIAALLVAAGNGPAAAQGAPKAKSPQTTTGFPNALQGFQRNRTDPVKIEANALEVRDKDKTAVFTGNVIVQQGDTQMRCKELTVHYEGGAMPTQPANAQPVAPQQIRRLVASGGVIITTKDQRATGNIGIYDARANTMTLSGNVVLLPGAEPDARRPAGRGSHVRPFAPRRRRQIEDPGSRARPVRPGLGQRAAARGAAGAARQPAQAACRSRRGNDRGSSVRVASALRRAYHAPIAVPHCSGEPVLKVLSWFRSKPAPRILRARTASRCLAARRGRAAPRRSPSPAGARAA